MDPPTSSYDQNNQTGCWKFSKNCNKEKPRVCFCCKTATQRMKKQDCNLYGKNIGYRECDVKYNVPLYNCNNQENEYNPLQIAQKKCEARCKSAQSRNESSQISAILQPEIYHSDSENETHVRKSNSKIKWARPGVRPPKKSRYHIRCAAKSFRKPPKRHPIKKSTLISDAQVEKILISEMETRKKFKNECYCHQNVQKPLITSPKHNKYKQNLKPDHRSRSPSPVSTLYGLETLRKAQDVIKYSPESQFLKRIKNEAGNIYNCNCERCFHKKWEQSLKYTECRAAVEKSYHDMQSQRRLHECKYVKVPSNSPSSTIVNLLNEESSKNFAHACDKIHNTERIRKDNFFETHSTDEVGSYIPPHNCVHKFELDDRLLPKPLNTDCYGTSRCTICDKPMKYERKTSVTSSTKSPLNNNSSGNLSKGMSQHNSIYTNQKSVKDELNDPRNVPSKATTKSCLRKTVKDYPPSIPCELPRTEHFGSTTTVKSALASSASGLKKINIGNNSDIIDINIEPEKYFREKTVRFRPNVIPHNSLALRYQKGVI